MSEPACTCSTWWVIPRALHHCALHAYGEGPIPQHNLDESRKSFACLDESYRALIRVNGNYAMTSDGDGELTR